MSVPSTYAFDLDADRVLTEAWSRAFGGADMTGSDGRTAVRAMSLLLLEWQNRHILSWSVEQATQALTAATASYTLAADTWDVLDAVLRRSDVDTPLKRMSRQDYVDAPNKTSAGRPHGWFLDRQRATTTLYLYPVPNSTDDTLVYWRIRRLRDVNLRDDLDIATRFLPAMVAGVAWNMARSRPDKADAARRAELREEYERDFMICVGEDRERVPLRFAADLSAYTRG